MDRRGALRGLSRVVAHHRGHHHPRSILQWRSTPTSTRYRYSLSRTFGGVSFSLAFIWPQSVTEFLCDRVNPRLPPREFHYGAGQLE